MNRQHITNLQTISMHEAGFAQSETIISSHLPKRAEVFQTCTSRALCALYQIVVY